MTQRRGQPINISDVLTAADLGPDLADLEFAIECGTALLPALTIDTLRTVVHRAGRNQLSDHPTDRTVNQALDAAVTVLVSELGPRYLHSMTAVSIREERDAVWQRCPQYTEPALPGGVDLYDHAAQAAAFTLIRSHMATRGVHTTYHTRDVALAWATPHAQQDPNADARAVHYVTSPAIAPRHRRDMDQATIAQLASQAEQVAGNVNAGGLRRRQHPGAVTVTTSPERAPHDQHFLCRA